MSNKGNIFETENFKELKQKEKMGLYLLIILMFLIGYSINITGKILENKKIISYNKENELIYNDVIYSRNSIGKEGDFTIDEVIELTKKYSQSMDVKKLSFNDLENYKYIEFFINYHLTKIGYGNIKIGDEGFKYVNFSKQTFELLITTNKEDDIIYLLEEFHKAGYLSGIEIEKQGNLFIGKIKLTFIIN